MRQMGLARDAASVHSLLFFVNKFLELQPKFCVLKVFCSLFLWIFLVTLVDRNLLLTQGVVQLIGMHLIDKIGALFAGRNGQYKT